MHVLLLCHLEPEGTCIFLKEEKSWRFQARESSFLSLFYLSYYIFHKINIFHAIPLPQSSVFIAT